MDFLVLLLELSLEVKEFLYVAFFPPILLVCMGWIPVSFDFILLLGNCILIMMKPGQLVYRSVSR